jgi:TolA-binding protein
MKKLLTFLSLFTLFALAAYPATAQEKGKKAADAAATDANTAAGPAAATLSPSQQKAADLEAKLRQTLESSEEGAKIMLELIDLYHGEGRVFGLVRAGRTFVNAQAGHPKHEDVMWKLFEGLMVTSRNDEIRSTGLQFVERYPNSPKAAEVHRELARVFERDGKRREAADQFRLAWEKTGAAGVGLAARAFGHYSELRSADAATVMGDMALKLMDQLPANTSAAQFAVTAMYQARNYGNQHALCNRIGAKLFQKKIPLIDRQQWEIHGWMGDSYVADKQFANAIVSYRAAIANKTDSPEIHRSLIRSLYDSQAAQNDLKAAVDAYLAGFPNESLDRKVEMRTFLPQAKARANDFAGAMAEAAPILKEHGGLASSLFSWANSAAAAVRKPDSAGKIPDGAGDQFWAQAEQIYIQAVAAKPAQAHLLHYYAAISLYRDQRKDVAKARQLVRDHLLYAAPLPEAGSEFRSAMDWMLDSAANDAEFQAEVKRQLAHALTHAHYLPYGSALEAWLPDAKKAKEPEIKARYQFAQAEYEKFRATPTVKLWESAMQQQMKGAGARDQLLKTNLLPEARLKLLRLHAYDLRNYAGNDQRSKSVAFYEEIAKLAPADLANTRAWIEAAAAYATPEQAKAALAFIQKIDLPNLDPLTWYYASNTARRVEAEPALQKQVYEWIRRNQARTGGSNTYASQIIDNLTFAKLDAEATAYLNECVKREPNHADTATAVQRLLAKIVLPVPPAPPAGAPAAPPAPPVVHAERVAFLKPFLAQPSDNHGQYSFWLAEEYLKGGDFANFEKTCTEARAVRDARLLRPNWSWGGASTWVSQAVASETMSAENKAIVFRSVAAMEYGRESAVGKMAMLSVNGHELPAMERLKQYRDATMSVAKDGTSYQYLYPWAQKAMGRKEFAEAASLATGLLNNVASVGADTEESTRALIREAYGKLGALGMEVSADNPMAPLLEIGLHLRLGDQQRALEAYSANKGRFDEYLLELPVELVAFVADSYVVAGGEENHTRAEDILRRWMVKHSESDKFLPSEKAQIQLLLAKNYDRASRFEVARSEYTTVVNRYPDTEEAIEARFGVGETLLAQKIFDQAEETFNELASSPIAKVRIRGMFLQGVLESRKGNSDSARDIFRDVLGAMPDVALANEALYNLAEVYRGEQRFLEQLELLRTVGRLGRESKRWHEPGRALSIVVQDSDLGISRGHTRIPVEVVTVPGGDREMAHIVSGGAGKGLFIGEIPTALGAVQAGNGTLEIGGNDLVKVDYPEDFKKEFKFEPLPTGDIGMAADAVFRMASSTIVDEKEESEAERLQREQREEENLDERRSISRPPNQIKPGNPVYLRVDDFDRDLSGEPDEVRVKVATTSGDEVQAVLRETGSHTGTFEGTVATSDLPAGAQATDTAIDHSPLMAIDKDPATAWVSQPDGLAPKFLSVDLKDLKTVTTGTFTTPNPQDQAPARARLQGSHDGRFWYPLAEHPKRESVEPTPGGFARMNRRVWKGKSGANLADWAQIQKVASNAPDETVENVEEMRYFTDLPVDPEERRKRNAAPAMVIWQGVFIQPRAGAVRFEVRGQIAAAMVNGMLALPPSLVTQQLGFDVYLEAGLHQVVFVGATNDSGARPVEVLRSRENPNLDRLTATRFVPEDFDLNQPFAKELKTAEPYQLGSMIADDQGNWKFDIAARELRHVRFVVDEYLGQAVAINTVTITGPEAKYIPTEADLMQLSQNNVLELTSGDRIEATYIDELPTGGNPRNRGLNQMLAATYFNATLSPIAYDFDRNTSGQAVEIEKDLLRIDPGGRVVIEVVDYDRDSTGQQDTLEVEAQVGDGAPIKLTATETEPTSGIFKIEVDTYDPEVEAAEKAKAAAEAAKKGASEPKADAGAEAAPAPAEPKEPATPRLAVKPGSQVFLAYRDAENTFPGHAIDRESAVFVRTPTDGAIRIVETRSSLPDLLTNRPSVAQYLPAREGREVKGVSYDVPFTVEVVDPDAARDSRSSVVVELSLEGVQAPPVKVKCVVSSAHSQLEETMAGVTNPALHRGRFVGQVLMRLGGPESPRLIPKMPDMKALVGEALPPEVPAAIPGEGAVPADPNAPAAPATPAAAAAETGANPALTAGMISVLNVTGANIIVANYNDAETTTGAPVIMADKGQLIANARLIATDSAYEKQIETLQVGERLYLRLEDADRDVSEARDKVAVSIEVSHGEKETVELEENLAHSGVFTGSLLMKAQNKPTPANLVPGQPEIETFFGEKLNAGYLDPRPAAQDAEMAFAAQLPISDGTDGLVSSFTKVFGDEDLAIQTQFHVAESYFELFKSHLELERKEEAEEDLKNGRRILEDLREDFPDPKHVPRIAYLLGQFAQELKDWNNAITAYEEIVRVYPDHSLAADAQYKLGQCYEEAKRFDDALEAYVTLAATYPQNPLISNVMIRINEYYYQKEEYTVAAQVGVKFLERFDSHEWAPRMAFRVGQCYYKSEQYVKAGTAFDDFVKRFPEDDLTSQSLFWAGESYRQGNNISFAFRRYNRCRWDFPESDAAKYARGRLALPEMIAQFEREAQNVEMEQNQNQN